MMILMSLVRLRHSPVKHLRMSLLQKKISLELMSEDIFLDGNNVFVPPLPSASDIISLKCNKDDDTEVPTKSWFR